MVTEIEIEDTAGAEMMITAVERGITTVMEMTRAANEGISLSRQSWLGWVPSSQQFSVPSSG